MLSIEPGPGVAATPKECRNIIMIQVQEYTVQNPRGKDKESELSDPVHKSTDPEQIKMASGWLG